MPSEYEVDVSAWAARQAALLRRLAAGERVNDADVDWANIAEELEAVGRSERRELRSRTERLLQHLLKWKFQPAYRSRSWKSTIRTQRREIVALLDDNPSLRQTLPIVMATAYPVARTEAAEETGLLDLPETLPFDVGQILEGPLPE
jgi:hypothetical protein